MKRLSFNKKASKRRMPRKLDKWDMWDIADKLRHAALICMNKRQYDKAEPLLRKAISLEQKTYGKTSVYVEINLKILYALYWQQGKFVKAHRVLNKLIRLSEKKYGSKSTNTKKLQKQLLRLNKKLEK